MFLIILISKRSFNRQLAVVVEWWFAIYKFIYAALWYMSIYSGFIILRIASLAWVISGIDRCFTGIKINPVLRLRQRAAGRPVKFLAVQVADVLTAAF